MIDYDNGHDYLQRNGYAMREMFKVARDWRDDAHVEDPPDCRLREAWAPRPVVGVCVPPNWAIPTASRKITGVGLFIAVDGPFHGANIPIGLQAIADFLKDEAAEGELFQIALNSPAARTLMPRTRLVGVDLPKKNSPRPAPGWYVADPRHREHYDLVNQDWFGLPPHHQERRHRQRQRYWNPAGRTTTSRLAADFVLQPRFQGQHPRSGEHLGQTDHDGGHIFHGHLRKFLSWRTRDLYLGPQADWLDVAPGDLRFTPLQLAQAWNGADDPFGTMEVTLPFHNFSTTSSVLYTRDKSPYYFPAQDPNAAANIPFDAFQWQKCNLAHVAITNSQLQFVQKEIRSFMRGRTPTHKAQYSEPCGTPEPVDRCLGYVDWFENPSRPTQQEGLVRRLPTASSRACREAKQAS